MNVFIIYYYTFNMLWVFDHTYFTLELLPRNNTLQIDPLHYQKLKKDYSYTQKNIFKFIIYIIKYWKHADKVIFINVKSLYSEKIDQNHIHNMNIILQFYI